MKLVKGVVVAALAAGVIVAAGLGLQPGVTRPYHNGTVWDVSFIRVKPGMDEAYMGYLAGSWKAEQEALRNEGVNLSYKVLTTESDSATDYNVILMTEFKDLATMEANESKADTITQKVMGDDQKQMQGYKERSEIREIVGGRLSREIILEPKK